MMTTEQLTELLLAEARIVADIAARNTTAADRLRAIAEEIAAMPADAKAYLEQASGEEMRGFVKALRFVEGLSVATIEDEVRRNALGEGAGGDA
jgi:hypothetical protein